jgi:hypothetical protein
VGERKVSTEIGADSVGEIGRGLEWNGVGDKAGDSEIDMDELKDWSTSMGRSVSVRVGEGTGEEKRVEGKDSMRGDEENEKLILVTKRSRCYQIVS